MACEGQSLEGADFSGSILTYVRFAGADLTGANLKGANLSCANFDGATLKGTVFTKANLSDAQFCNCDLTRRLGFSDCSMHGTNFGNGDLTGAIMKGVSIRTYPKGNRGGTHLDGAMLRVAGFTGADLRDCHLEKIS